LSSGQLAQHTCSVPLALIQFQIAPNFLWLLPETRLSCVVCLSFRESEEV